MLADLVVLDVDYEVTRKRLSGPQTNKQVYALIRVKRGCHL